MALSSGEGNLDEFVVKRKRRSIQGVLEGVMSISDIRNRDMKINNQFVSEGVTLSMFLHSMLNHLSTYSTSYIYLQNTGRINIVGILLLKFVIIGSLSKLGQRAFRWI